MNRVRQPREIRVPHHRLQPFPVSARLEGAAFHVHRRRALPQSDTGTLRGPSQQPRGGGGGHGARAGASGLGFELVVAEARAQMPPDLAEGAHAGIGARDEEFLGAHIGGGKEQRAARRQTIAAGPADFLIVGLDAARKLGVGYEPDFRLVHPHAEGVGGHDDIQAAGQEIVLDPAALLVAHAGMVASGTQPQAREHPAPEVHRLTRGGVHDSGQSDFPNQALQSLLLLLPPPAALDREGEVGSLEAGYQLERAPQAELIGDVGPYLGRGRGGKRRRGDAQLRTEPGEPAIIRPKIMAPLADAVGLVHHEADRPRALQRGAEGAVAQPLGGDVDQVQPTPGQRGLRRLPVGDRHSRVQRRGGDPPGAKRVHLVLHQGDQRRDHDRGAVEQERRKLEAERLARARGHHRHEVPPLENGEGGFSLARSEAAQAEALAQGTLESVGVREGGRGKRHPPNVAGARQPTLPRPRTPEPQYAGPVREPTGLA